MGARKTKEFVASLVTVEAIKLAGVLHVDCAMPPWSETDYQDRAVALREALVHRIDAKVEAHKKRFTVVLTNEEVAILKDGARDVRNSVVEQILEQA